MYMLRGVVMRSVSCVRALSRVVGLASCAPWLGGSPAVDDQLIVAKSMPAMTGRWSDSREEATCSRLCERRCCVRAFVNATNSADALATNQTLDAGLVGATSIADATMSTASALKAITITTAGIVFGKSIMNEYVTIYTFGTHLYKVR